VQRRNVYSLFVYCVESYIISRPRRKGHGCYNGKYTHGCSTVEDFQFSSFLHRAEVDDLQKLTSSSSSTDVYLIKPSRRSDQSVAPTWQFPTDRRDRSEIEG